MPIDFDAPLVRLAVVTDLHAYGTKEKSKDSAIDFTCSPSAGANPLIDLIGEVEKRNIKADALICAGDICNMADYSGLSAAWRHLNILKTSLGAKDILATCGNHDLDSRYLSGDPDPDPKGGLLSLVPGFPFADSSLSDKFWARNFVVVRLSSGVVVLILNTSAYHGGKQEEIDFGRISTTTIESIKNEIGITKDAPGHILICHHHPMPLQGWDGVRPDGEYIKNGPILLDALIACTGKSWLVIHGHRHIPRLRHGSSPRSALPFILGAGSLGARMPGIPNQFHIVSVHASGDPDHASLVGTIDTWGWTDSGRWDKSSSGAGLPPICGFGYRGQINALADEIAKFVGTSFKLWQDIICELPSVNLLLPDDMKQLEDALVAKGIFMLRDSARRIMQVGK